MNQHEFAAYESCIMNHEESLSWISKNLTLPVLSLGQNQFESTPMLMWLSGVIRELESWISKKSRSKSNRIDLCLAHICGVTTKSPVLQSWPKSKGTETLCRVCISTQPPLNGISVCLLYVTQMFPDCINSCADAASPTWRSWLWFNLDPRLNRIPNWDLGLFPIPSI